MKKSVRLLLLLLMLFTSLTCGTMAVYTSTIDLTPVVISAKRFVLGVNQGSQDEFDLRIGPGDLVSYQFDVTNQNANGDVSEVDMDLLIDADFSAIRASLPNVEIQLMLRTGSSNIQVAAADASGILSYHSSSAFEASQAELMNFSLTFYWSDGDLPSSFINGNSVVLPITVYVKGVQHVS